MGGSAGERARMGMVHGRFQLFHLEHLSYVLAALERCDELVIGITNPDDTERTFAEESDHRHLAEANPYSFLDRQRMIRGSLADAGVDLARVSIVPFHVLTPERWPAYIPAPGRATQFMRIFSAWEERKAAEFRARGYDVVDLEPGREKAFSATDGRALLAAGDPAWRELVPAATARVVDELAGALGE